MADYTAKRINDMEAGFGGGFVKARAELGVTAFGMQVIQLPPDYADYPEHDHAESGQEEVFVALGGSGWIDIEGERVELDGETLVRVGAETQTQGLLRARRACGCSSIGGCPGEAYKISPDRLDRLASDAGASASALGAAARLPWSGRTRSARDALRAERTRGTSPCAADRGGR